LFGSVVREGFAYVEREEDKLKTRLERKDKAHSSSGPES